MSLLAHPHYEYGVDIEGLARQVLRDELQSLNGAWLDSVKEEEAITFLIETIWELSVRYEPNRSKLSFSTYAYRIGRWRVTDWYRSQFGDRRYRKAAMPETLEGREELIGEDGLGFEEALQSINERLLSPDARVTLRKLMRPRVAEGLTIAELADRFGYPRREISRRLKGLKLELRDIGLEKTAPFPQNVDSALRIDGPEDAPLVVRETVAA